MELAGYDLALERQIVRDGLDDVPDGRQTRL
jgi:hypothetical protein